MVLFFYKELSNNELMVIYLLKIVSFEDILLQIIFISLKK